MKKQIQWIQLPEKTRGIEIFRMTDELIPFLRAEVIDVPHRHDHYTCFFIEEGMLRHCIDRKEVEIKGPGLLISYPGQMHQVTAADHFDGWIMAFDPKFIHEHAAVSVEASFSDVIALQLSKEQQELFSSLFELINYEVKQGEAAVTAHLVNAFFLKTAGLFQLQEHERTLAYSSRSIEIVKTFRKLIREHFVKLKKPSEYAQLMNISVSYLNDTVKSVTGFSATHFIQQEIFRESQRLLCYTDKSIKEIAFSLGYEDYKYFIRLFSKSVGVSPSNFRKQAQ